MAKLYKVDGTVELIEPTNGVNWTLEELQALVGGYIEIVRTVDNTFLILDEEGTIKNKLPNRIATERYIYGEMFVIVGDAIEVDTRLELDGPDSEEE